MSGATVRDWNCLISELIPMSFMNIAMCQVDFSDSTLAVQMEARPMLMDHPTLCGALRGYNTNMSF